MQSTTTLAASGNTIIFIRMTFIRIRIVIRMTMTQGYWKSWIEKHQNLQTKSSLLSNGSNIGKDERPTELWDIRIEISKNLRNYSMWWQFADKETMTKEITMPTQFVAEWNQNPFLLTTNRVYFLLHTAMLERLYIQTLIWNKKKDFLIIEI